MILGCLLSIWGCVALGKSFGVTPALRGKRIVNGPYKFFNHPIYVGYWITELSYVLIVSSFRNLIILCASGIAYYVRAKSEADLLKGPDQLRNKD
jgi:protein-S-isoprenylcysteine O-methyltransferase Ste14